MTLRKEWQKATLLNIQKTLYVEAPYWATNSFTLWLTVELVHDKRLQLSCIIQAKLCSNHWSGNKTMEACKWIPQGVSGFHSEQVSTATPNLWPLSVFANCLSQIIRTPLGWMNYTDSMDRHSLFRPWWNWAFAPDISIPQGHALHGRSHVPWPCHFTL